MKPLEQILVRTQPCPACGESVSMVPYDIGSGPEMSCPSCEWCWGADGQDLKPLDVSLMLPPARGGEDVQVAMPLIDQRRTMGPP